jgi:hypothetical protein
MTSRFSAPMHGCCLATRVDYSTFDVPDEMVNPEGRGDYEIYTLFIFKFFISAWNALMWNTVLCRRLLQKAAFKAKLQKRQTNVFSLVQVWQMCHILLFR